MSPSAAAPAASTASATVVEGPEQLLKAWTAALNAADLGALEPLYADQVRFYGSTFSRDEVIARKRKALAASPGFSQRVMGQPSYQTDGDRVRIGFQKRSGLPGKQTDVRSTLVLTKVPRLAIAEETDAATEKRFRRENTAKPTDCSSAVSALVDSTPLAQRLSAIIEKNLKPYPESADLHEGGVGPFMPSDTDGKSYEVWIGVHHPERFENYGTFIVTLTGDVTADSFELGEGTQHTTATSAALADFVRLCPVK